MQKVASRFVVTLGLAGFIAMLGLSSGCDSGNTTSDAPLSEEAKKADSNIQGGMMEFMKTKGQSKTTRGR
jgi:hypothetical protein